MSLLDSANEDIVIYHEVAYEDADGNQMFRASALGTPARATIQPIGQSGTSSRRAEQNDEGYETEETYRMRLPRSYDDTEIGAHARIEWRGVRWSVIGKARHYRGSPRTSHIDYQLRRT
jgi:hypothetical protein